MLVGTILQLKVFNSSLKFKNPHIVADSYSVITAGVSFVGSILNTRIKDNYFTKIVSQFPIQTTVNAQSQRLSPCSPAWKNASGIESTQQSDMDR